MSKKKITDPERSMEELIARAVEAAKAPFMSDRKAELPSLRSVAEELGTTVIRTRKLLITAGYFESPLSRSVQMLKAEGKTIKEIGAALRLKPAAVYGYLPYELRPYNLPETTSNADRHKRYRGTKKLRAAVDTGDDKKISASLWRCVIIVPVYKVALYLRQCVESIINQTYRDLEILLIDDGSPDECGEICEEYKNRDNRIRVFHTENRGLSAARNIGLQNAAGDCIGFVIPMTGSNPICMKCC